MKTLHPFLTGCPLALALACVLLVPVPGRAQFHPPTFTGSTGNGAVVLSSTMGTYNSPFSMMGGMGMMGMNGMGMMGMTGGFGGGMMMGGMGMGGMGMMGMGGKAFGFNGGFGQ